MPILIVKMPKDWRKVNVSRFVARHKIKKIDTSLVLDVPEEELVHISEVLTRNQCKVLLAHREPKERRIVEQLLDLCKRIREGKAKPDVMKSFTSEVFKRNKKLSDKITELIHIAMDFEEDPNFLTLGELEEEGKALLDRL
ncbi:MAG: hypothetical protein HYU39_04770 [Thaumarchaeota archaeon]|nr:hypothetical protein [Nitrososphaerota archaeon]